MARYNAKSRPKAAAIRIAKDYPAINVYLLFVLVDLGAVDRAFLLAFGSMEEDGALLVRA